MTKDWVEQRNIEFTKKVEDAKNRVINFISNYDLTKTQKARIVKSIELGASIRFITFDIAQHTKLKIERVEKQFIKEGIIKLLHILEAASFERKVDGVYRKYDKYLDSKAIELNGDVLITDPCYIMKETDYSTSPNIDDYDMSDQTEAQIYRVLMDKWHEDNDDWSKTNCGFDLEKIGITNYVTQTTLYGDWGCTMYDMTTETKVGEFCADAGLVSIIDLKQALDYNKEGVEKLINKGFCATVIKNFKGTGQVKVKEVTCEDEGKIKTDYEAYVELIGVSKTTGKDVRFLSVQTEY